jgi:hypothetical protein
VEALGIFLNLLDGFAVEREAGVGLVEEEKVIVPFAERFLCGLVAGGQGGGGFGGVAADLCEIACGLGGFAEGVEVLVVLRVEAANVFGEPALGHGDKLCAAETKFERGAEDGFEVVEPEFDFFLFLFEAFGEFAFGFFSDSGEVFAEKFGVGSAIVGGEQIGLDVGVAHGTCCAAHFAERALERFGFFFDAGDVGGEHKEFECGFDSPGGGTEMMDAVWRGFFQAGGDGCLEHQGLTEKDGHGLWHDVTFLLEMLVRACTATLLQG